MKQCRGDSGYSRAFDSFDVLTQHQNLVFTIKVFAFIDLPASSLSSAIFDCLNLDTFVFLSNFHVIKQLNIGRPAVY